MSLDEFMHKHPPARCLWSNWNLGEHEDLWRAVALCREYLCEACGFGEQRISRPQVCIKAVVAAAKLGVCAELGAVQVATPIGDIRDVREALVLYEWDTCDGLASFDPNSEISCDALLDAANKLAENQLQSARSTNFGVGTHGAYRWSTMSDEFFNWRSSFHPYDDWSSLPLRASLASCGGVPSDTLFEVLQQEMKVESFDFDFELGDGLDPSSDDDLPAVPGQLFLDFCLARDEYHSKLRSVVKVDGLAHRATHDRRQPALTMYSDAIQVWCGLAKNQLISHDHVEHFRRKSPEGDVAPWFLSHARAQVSSANRRWSAATGQCEYDCAEFDDLNIAQHNLNNLEMQASFAAHLRRAEAWNNLVLVANLVVAYLVPSTAAPVLRSFIRYVLKRNMPASLAMLQGKRSERYEPVIQHVHHEEKPAQITTKEAANLVAVQEAGFIERLIHVPVGVAEDAQVEIADRCIMIITFKRQPIQLINRLKHGPELAPCREALEAAGHHWLLPMGAFVFVQPHHYRSALQAAPELRASTVLFSGAYEGELEAAVTAAESRSFQGGFAKTRDLVELEDSVATGGPCLDAPYPQIHKTFLCYLAVENFSNMVRSTTDAHSRHGRNPRRY